MPARVRVWLCLIGLVAAGVPAGLVGCSRSGAPTTETTPPQAATADGTVRMDEPAEPTDSDVPLSPSPSIAVEAPAGLAEPAPFIPESQSSPVVSETPPASLADYPPGMLETNQAATPAAEAPATEAPAAEMPVAETPPAETSGGFGVNPLREPEQPAPESLASGGAPAAKAEPAPAKKPFGKGKHSGIPFDPIKEHGTYFDGWGKPQLALVISGRQDGYLEPCGCAGLDRMKGGLSRRHSLFEQLRKQGWPVVGLDVGGLIKGFGRQAELKFHTSVEAMRKMGYDAIAFGKNDLQLPAAELVSVAASVDSQQSPFVAANVGLFGLDSGMTSPSRILEAGGRKLGITAVLGQKYQQEVNNAEVAMADPREALAKVVPALKQEADLLILLAHATKEESIELARQFPDFDVVITSGGPPDPPPGKSYVEGSDTLLVEVGEKGMNVIVLGFFDDPKDPIRYQRVRLDARYPNSPDMKLLMTAYQDQLKMLGLAGLGIREVPHPQKEINGEFAGSEECRDCHKASHDIWMKSGHAKAWQTLVELDPPRTSDPECISCHVVGWDPQRYFPYESGFLSEKDTPHLVDVGCESCHGPGMAHVDAELEERGEEVRKKFREALVITKADSEKWQCVTCHDLDNSPDFDFQEYWPQVEHYEEEGGKPK